MKYQKAGILFARLTIILLISSVIVSADSKTETAIIQSVDVESRIVILETLQSEMQFRFKGSKDEIAVFLETNGFIATVEFRCVMLPDRNCDFISPYLFMVDGLSRKAIYRKFLKIPYRVWVAHGPSESPMSGGGAYTDGLIIHLDYDPNDQKNFSFLQLRIENPNQIGLISKYKRGDLIQAKDIKFPNYEPYHAYVNRVKMRIVAVIF